MFFKQTFVMYTRPLGWKKLTLLENSLKIWFDVLCYYQGVFYPYFEL